MAGHNLRIEPLDGAVGAVIHGASPDRALSDAEFAAIEQAMFDRIAIVLPDIEENVGWLRDFGRRFGPLVPHALDQYHHPETSEVSIIARHDGTAQSRTTAKPAGAFWHSDLSYDRAPSDAIFLYAQQVPARGGDTMVCNMAAAHAALPRAMKDRIEGLTAIHRWGWKTGGGTPQMTPEQKAKHPDVIHPCSAPPPALGPGGALCQPGLHCQDLRAGPGGERRPAGGVVRTRAAARILLSPFMGQGDAAGPRQPLVDARGHRRLHRAAPHAADDRRLHRWRCRAGGVLGVDRFGGWATPRSR